MPTIRENKQQQKALEEVSLALETLTAIQTVTDENWAGTLTLNYTAAGKKGRGSTIKLPLGDSSSKEFIAVQKLLRTFATRLGKEAIAKAEKHDIVLETKEVAILKGKTEHAEEPDALAPEHESTPDAPQADVPGQPPFIYQEAEDAEPPAHQGSSEWSGSAYDEAGDAMSRQTAEGKQDGGLSFEDALQAFQNH